MIWIFNIVFKISQLIFVGQKRRQTFGNAAMMDAGGAEPDVRAAVLGLPGRCRPNGLAQRRFHMPPGPDISDRVPPDPENRYNLQNVFQIIWPTPAPIHSHFRILFRKCVTEANIFQHFVNFVSKADKCTSALVGKTTNLTNKRKDLRTRKRCCGTTLDFIVFNGTFVSGGS